MKYRCKKCGTEFDVTGLSDVKCPKCGASGIFDIETVHSGSHKR